MSRQQNNNNKQDIILEEVRQLSARPIKNFPRYFVTECGEVFDRKNNRLCTKTEQANGYLQVSLAVPGLRNKRIAFYVHRLVAATFLDNSNNYKEVNHKDEDKTNNELANLEFCDRKYNVNYGSRNAKVSKPFVQYDLDLKPIRKFNNLSEASKEGFATSKISHALNRKKGSSEYKKSYWIYCNINHLLSA